MASGRILQALDPDSSMETPHERRLPPGRESAMGLLLGPPVRILVQDVKRVVRVFLGAVSTQQ